MNSLKKRPYKHPFYATAVLYGGVCFLIAMTDAQLQAAPITIADLATVQTQKILKELNKSTAADVSSKVKIPALEDSGHVKTSRAKRRAAASSLGKTHAIAVLATYGAPSATRAELSVNGAIHVVHQKTQIGPATVDTIQDGRVHLTVMHGGKPHTYVLQPGERVEVLQ